MEATLAPRAKYRNGLLLTLVSSYEGLLCKFFVWNLTDYYVLNILGLRMQVHLLGCRVSECKLADPFLHVAATFSAWSSCRSLNRQCISRVTGLI